MLITPEKHSADNKRDLLPRLGQINFVNCLPVVVPMRSSDWQHKANVVYATPAELNGAYAKNKLDIGAMSSFHFLKDGTMSLVDGLSISSDGAVASVMCYSKVPLSELNGARIAVPTSSATSINLLLVLLREVFDAVPQLTYSDNPDINDPSFEAALVIGDQALHAELAWSQKLIKADLGEWWRIVTGLPMVFGVWAARSAWVTENSNSFIEIAGHLTAAVKSGLSSEFEAVVEEGRVRTGMSKERMVKYFTCDLNYEMTERHHEALALYGQLCAKHGLFRSGRKRLTSYQFHFETPFQPAERG